MYYYECDNCASRFLTTTPVETCSKCEGVVRNLAVRQVA